MTLVILTILILACVLIATENVTKVNRAAVAIFAGTVGWVLYICFGMDFVTNEHSADYSHYLYLTNLESTSTNVKYFISRHIFLPQVGRAAEIVLFLLATMTIVDILNNNGCFDFVRQLLRTRSSRKMLWILAIVTFIISINLDNLTTTVLMLTIMHGIIPSRRQRMIFGSSILLAANCGGALTVIGNPEGLVLWNSGAVTATIFSFSLLLPCLAAWLIPTAMMQRMLPDRVETEWIAMPFRGDDTRLNVWQRLLMLLVGIGGLWFIPTFHNITKLSPFLGALCVLSILWIVNEIFNRKQSFGIDPERLSDYAKQIKEVHEMGVQIGIVIGGGNIFRGLSGSQKGFDRVKGADVAAPSIAAVAKNGKAMKLSVDKAAKRANILFQGQGLHWNHFAAFVCLIAAVYFVFMK